MTVQTLLPQNATDFELAFEQAVARAAGVPVELREAKHPDTSPADVLPFLGWELASSLWYADWTDDKKRDAARHAIELHRLKGTLSGISKHVAMVGGEVEKAITPPQAIYSGASLSREQREAWLSSLPQIRSWRYAQTGVKGRAIYVGGELYKTHIREKKFLLPSTAIERLRRRAKYVVGGIETQVEVTEYGSFFQIHMPAKSGNAVYCNSSYMNSRFLLPSVAKNRLITIAPATASPWRSLVGPSLQPVTSEPELIAQNGIAGAAVYTTQILYNKCFIPSTAKYRLFERYAIATGDTLIAQQKKKSAVQFMGVGRYGMPAHTAELKIKVRGKKPEWSAGYGKFIPHLKFWRPRDTEYLERVLDAVRVSKRLSDRVLVDTQTSKRFIAGQPNFAGTTIVI